MTEYTFDQLHKLWNSQSKTETAERINSMIDSGKLISGWRMLEDRMILMFSFEDEEE